jgi:LysR family carnitine catabolism transcriptional activator
MLLPAAIAAMRVTHPDAEIMIRDDLSEGVLEAVAEGRAHIGLTAQPVPSSKLRYRPLCEDAFGLVCQANSPLAAPGPVSWQILTRQPLWRWRPPAVCA